MRSCILAIVSTVALFVLAFGCSQEPEADYMPPERPQAVESDPADAETAVVANADGFVGRKVCADCHIEEHRAWVGSHHDQAMKVAAPDTVLGDFNNAEFTYYGRTSRFYKRDRNFFVETYGPDGELHEYEIAYTYGITPLQQYLIEFPRGYIQCLNICWDTRPEEEGGQRWFHLYPNEDVHSKDILHWTGPYQNWNHMCAECHSTNVKKNFDLDTMTFDTSWFEINVSCETCHGPGADHTDWANRYEENESVLDSEPDMGLAVRLKPPTPPEWIMNEETGIAERVPPLESDVLVETCGRCHSRRTMMTEDYEPGTPLMNTHLVANLREHLYHADGQILDEVYVYGSFLQSKMHAAGVTCNDCHDPHTMQTRLQGNALCALCHLPTKYDTPDHHFHEAGTEGANCVDCHMVARNYMVVDPRRDHSFRNPRPDLTLKIGTPNACNDCHTNVDAQWSLDYLEQWYPDYEPPEHYGEAFALAREGNPSAAPLLMKWIRNPEAAGIVRATAFDELAQFLSPQALALAVEALNDENPMVRRAALGLVEFAPPQDRFNHIWPLLDDPVRTVRVMAARILATTSVAAMGGDLEEKMEKGLAEYFEVELTNNDRDFAHMNIGLVHSRRGELVQAEKSYRTALKLEPRSVQPRVNLADLYRSQGKDAEGEQILREGIEIDPKSAPLRHALGLLLVRQNRHDEALGELKLAAELDPDDPGFSYVYGVALNATGRPTEALDVLGRALELHPYDRDLLYALATMSRDQGAIDAARGYTRRIIDYYPDDPNAQALLDSLDAARGTGGES